MLYASTLLARKIGTRSVDYLLIGIKYVTVIFFIIIYMYWKWGGVTGFLHHKQIGGSRYENF